jgi:NADPH-dependent 2,4-dienoyl-CoA reductase/sulfur reductase-like enzyme
MRPSPSSSVTIIGAGPYGLAAAAHLRRAGVDVAIFGEVMEFWHKQMPKGMILRSRKRSSNISDPERTLTLDAFGQAPSDKLSHLTLDQYLEYGHWFQARVAPNVDARRVVRVEAENGAFKVTLEDREERESERVVVAAGLSPFPWKPPPFDSLPTSFVSHSCEHDDLTRFQSQDLLVIGAGQSALESAALLHEAGANVEVIARAPGVHWLREEANGHRRRQLSDMMFPPTDVGGRVSGWIAAFPDLFRHLPARHQPTVSYRCIKPAGAGWLLPRLGDVPITTGHSVTSAEPIGERLLVRLDNGSERHVDHVLLGTGYRVDVSRYPFLAPELVRSLLLVEGYPVLGPGLEASVPGLHFVGAPAAMSFGPIMRFVVGTWYAAPALARRVLGKRQPPLRFSF